MPDEEPLQVEVDGQRLRITHPSKVMFPPDELNPSDITKAEILQYYLAVAPVLMPHLRDRPVIIHAFPHGTKGRPYHRRWTGNQAPPWLSRVHVEEEDEDAPVVGTTADLMWIANQDSVELHPWQSRAGHLHEPDLVVFDLDPGQGTPFDRTCQAALVIREVMDQLGLVSQAKTTGGKGIHVNVGVAPEQDHGAVREWVMKVASLIREHRGDLFTTEYAHHRRVGKVLLDYNQNGFGRSTAGIYSVRPMPGATVSAPVTWDEVASGTLTPQQFTIATVPAPIERLGDVAAAVPGAMQHLPAL
jgi:bifunctional non-homologous end joining protein LigD